MFLVPFVSLLHFVLKRRTSLLFGKKALYLITVTKGILCFKQVLFTHQTINKHLCSTLLLFNSSIFLFYLCFSFCKEVVSKVTNISFLLLGFLLDYLLLSLLLLVLVVFLPFVLSVEQAFESQFLFCKN